MNTYNIAGAIVNGCTLSGFVRLQGDVSHIIDGEDGLKPGWKTRKYILRTIHRVRKYKNWWEKGQEALFLKELETILRAKSPSHGKGHEGRPEKAAE